MSWSPMPHDELGWLTFVLPNRPIPKFSLVSLIRFPRLMEDPQVVPYVDEGYFYFLNSGIIDVNLTCVGQETEIAPDLSTPLTRSLHDDLMSQLEEEIVFANGWESPRPGIPYLAALNEHQWEAVARAEEWRVLSNYSTVLPIYFPVQFRLPLYTNKPVTFTFEGYHRQYLALINPTPRPLQLTGTIAIRPAGSIQLPLTHIHDLSITLIAAATLGLSALVTSGTAYFSSSTKFRGLNAFLAGLMGLKMLYLILDALNIIIIQKRGYLKGIERLIPRLLAKTEDVGVLYFFLIVALGWKVYRASLSDTEWRFCWGISFLSMYLAIFEVSVGGFQVSRYILAALAYLCIMVAVNFDIAVTVSQIAEQPFSSTTGETYIRHRLYIIFRNVFVAHILKPSILMGISLLIVGDGQPWGKYAIATFDIIIDVLCFWALMYAFWPRKDLAVIEEVLAPKHPLIFRPSVNGAAGAIDPPIQAEN